eukprot:SAG11_NODE_20652_length_441_cov_0.704678_1_plen_67_part_01
MSLAPSHTAAARPVPVVTVGTVGSEGAILRLVALAIVRIAAGIGRRLSCQHGRWRVILGASFVQETP